MRFPNFPVTVAFVGCVGRDTRGPAVVSPMAIDLSSVSAIRCRAVGILIARRERRVASYGSDTSVLTTTVTTVAHPTVTTGLIWRCLWLVTRFADAGSAAVTGSSP